MYRSEMMIRSIPEADTLSEKLALATTMSADLFQKPANIMAVIMAGAELGIPPMASIDGIYLVQGKPVFSADLKVAIVMRSAHCEYFRRISADDTEATYATRRRGSPEQRLTWTMDQARKAGINGKENWRHHPRQMLSARCKAELAADVYPDVLAGISAMDPVAMGTVHEFEPLPSPSDPVIAHYESLIAVATVDEMAAVSIDSNGWTELQKAHLRPLFMARMEALK